MSSWQDFTGLNRGYVLELDQKYRHNPSSVDPDTRALFETWTPPDRPDRRRRRVIALDKVVGAVNLAESIRRYGHLAAQLDPLHSRPPLGDPSLLASTHGVTDEDLRALPGASWSRARSTATTALDAIESLRRVYCSTIGYDYSHVFVPEERDWLRQAAKRGGSGLRPTRSIRSRSSTACRRSKRSSGSCSARFRARRGSRSKAST